MSNPFSTTRAQLKTIASTVTNLTVAGRVKLGCEDESDTTEFFNNIGSTAKLMIGSANSDLQNGQTQIGEFEVISSLYFGFPADADQDFTAIEQIMYDLVKAWNLISNWAASGAQSPINTTTRREPSLNLKPVVGKYSITTKFKFS